MKIYTDTTAGFSKFLKSDKHEFIILLDDRSPNEIQKAATATAHRFGVRIKQTLQVYCEGKGWQDVRSLKRRVVIRKRKC